MGEVIKLRAPQAPAFTDVTEMLNQWWKDTDKKPLAKPMKIRHVVEMAHSHGWTLEECYDALNVTWGFSEAAFETKVEASNASTLDYIGIYFDTTDNVVKLVADVSSGATPVPLLLAQFTNINTDALADTFLAGLTLQNFDLV